MSGISTGVGLISGLPIADIVDQLMAIEGRPKTLIQNRNEVLKAQQEALKDVNKLLLALKTSSMKLTLPTAFRQTSASSSNESILTATSGAGAIQGNYSFVVNRLVQAQQTITRGFADAGTSAVAPDGGTLTFERGEARLETDTLLSSLNGGAGVQRGLIRITDRSGASTVVDLSAVVTVDDVVNKINSASGISVVAEVDGDRLKLTDASGQTATNLVVADVGSTATATSLGLVGSSGAGEIVGSQVNTVGASTLLASLNDGNGVRNKSGVADLRISAGGTDYDIDLDGLTSLGQVMDEIADATGGAVTGAVTADGTGLQLSGPSGFTVASLNSSGAAEDLGIAGSADGAGTLEGDRLIATLNSKLLRNLNGGAGVGLGTISITNRAGGSTDIDLSGAVSVQDVIDRINDAAPGSGVTASLNSAGNGLKLTDTSGGAGSLTIGDAVGTSAADLGLLGTHTGESVDGGNLQLKYIGEGARLEDMGITGGQIRITDSAGVTSNINLTSSQTFGDVIDRINASTLKINARINDNGDGIVLEDTGPGTVAIKVEDSGSTTAKDLNLLGEAAAPGDDLDGSFERTVEIDSDDTLTDVATKIADASIGISASVINDGSAGTPYRLSLSAKTAGTNGAFVFDDGGLGFNAANLAHAQDAVVFYGSSDPASAMVITSKTNTIKGLIPGVTVDLKATSDQPVQVTINADQEAMVTAMSEFVEAFNAITAKIEEYDSYDAETEERGVLLGDAGLATVQRQLFSVVINRNNDLTSQYNSLAQIGITVGRDSQLQFDQDKFRTALDADPEAVENLFKFKETEEGDDGETVITAKGIGVAIDEMLKRLTDPEYGALETRLGSIESQLQINDQRIADLDDILGQKRLKLEREFQAMERILAEMQQQAGALGGLAASR